MAFITCKICGGQVEVEQGKTYGICPFHGGPVTFPKDVSDERINLFNRADAFRRQNAFDKAISAYEKILEKDQTDAEAHWGAALSRFGIEYVENPVTFDRKPTLHRLQTTSILADPDYQAALEYAPDEDARRLYEQQAQEIDDIQKKVLEQSQREDQFDIFISYKTTDADGNPTPDSAYANQIYRALLKEGYNVFFARETLKSRLGDEYEPIIFTALRSSQVMILIGTKREYLEAEWVRNEWTRYLDIMNQEHSKPVDEQIERQLIVCYRDLRPSDLPVELNMLQMLNMNDLGFMTDLTAGVKKIMEGGRRETYIGKNDELSLLLMRGMNKAELGEFAAAHKLADQVLAKEPNNATAQMIELLAQLKVNTPDELVNQPKELTHNRLYIMACRNATGAQKKRYESYNKKIVANLEAARKQKKLDGIKEKIAELNDEFKSTSDDDSEALENICVSFEEQAALLENEELADFGNAAELASQCRERADKIRHDAQVRKEERQRILEEELAKKRAVEEQARREREEKEQKRRAEKAEKERQEKERIAKIRRHKAHKRLAVFLVILILAGGVTAYKLHFEDQLAYGAAVRTIETAEDNQNGQLDYAATLLKGLGSDYQDVEARLRQIETDRLFYAGFREEAYRRYQQEDEKYRSPYPNSWYRQQYSEGVSLINQNRFDEAITILQNIHYYQEGDQNAEEQIRRAYMLKGDSLFQLGAKTTGSQASEKFIAAREAYQADGGYEDTPNKLEQTEAAILFSWGQYEQAYAAYTKLDPRYFTAEHKKWYSDRVQEADDKLINNDYEDAIRLYEAISYVQGVEQKLSDAHYQYAERLSANGQAERAAEQYVLAGGYKDSAERLAKIQADQLYDAGQYEAAYELYKSLKEDNQTHKADYDQMFVRADGLRTSGEYAKAIEAFEAILFMDSDAYPVRSKLKDTYLGYAELLLKQDRVEEALACFEKAETDAGDRLLKYFYEKGLKALAAGQPAAAREALARVGDYEDAEALLDRLSRYEEAEKYLYAQDVYAAMNAFREAGDIMDAAERAEACAKTLYDQAMKSASVADRVARLTALGDYADCRQQVQAIQDQYKQAQVAYASKDYATALPLFDALGDYEDAAGLAARCRLAQAEALVTAGQYEEALSIYAAMDPALLTQHEIEETTLRYAEALKTAGRTGKALTLCQSLGDYEPAKAWYDAAYQELVEALKNSADDPLTAMTETDRQEPAVMYQMARALEDAGRDDEAAQLYEGLNGYEDSLSRFQEIIFRQAQAAYKALKYSDVQALLNRIPGYRQAEADAMLNFIRFNEAETRRRHAKEEAEQQHYEAALAEYEAVQKEYEALGNYSLSARRVTECQEAIASIRAAMAEADAAGTPEEVGADEALPE